MLLSDAYQLHVGVITTLYPLRDSNSHYLSVLVPKTSVSTVPPKGQLSHNVKELSFALVIGVEPIAYRLTADCSTIELHQHTLKQKNP